MQIACLLTWRLNLHRHIFDIYRIKLLSWICHFVGFVSIFSDDHSLFLSKFINFIGITSFNKKCHPVRLVISKRFLTQQYPAHVTLSRTHRAVTRRMLRLQWNSPKGTAVPWYCFCVAGAGSNFNLNWCLQKAVTHCKVFRKLTNTRRDTSSVRNNSFYA